MNHRENLNRFLRERRKHLGAREEANLLRQFCLLVDSGFNFYEGLNILANGMTGPSKLLCEEIAEDVRRGMTLSRAFYLRKQRLTPMTPFLVETGEKSGRLPSTLRLAAYWAESNDALLQKVKSALVYPVFVLLVNLVMAAGLLLFILPAFVPLFGDQDLPLITTLVLTCSSLLRSPLVWFIAVLALVEGFVYFANPDARVHLRNFASRLPVLGTLLGCAAKTRFLSVISITGLTGLPIAESLKLAARSCGDQNFLDNDKNLQEALLSGEPIEDFFERNRDLYGNLITQGMRLSVETGDFAKVCGALAKFYQDETEHWAQQVKVLVEPLLMVFVACTTAIILLATYMPLGAFLKTLL